MSLNLAREQVDLLKRYIEQPESPDFEFLVVHAELLLDYLHTAKEERARKQASELQPSA